MQPPLLRTLVIAGCAFGAMEALPALLRQIVSVTDTASGSGAKVLVALGFGAIGALIGVLIAGPSQAGSGPSAAPKYKKTPFERRRPGQGFELGPDPAGSGGAHEAVRPFPKKVRITETGGLEAIVESPRNAGQGDSPEKIFSRDRCDVLESAERVFGDWNRAVAWLNSNVAALENQRPLDLLGSVKGADRVRYILNCIEHGVYA